MTTLAYGLLGGCMALLGFCLLTMWTMNKFVIEIRTVTLGVKDSSFTGLVGDMTSQRKFKHEAGNRLVALELGKMDKPGFQPTHSDMAG